MWHKLAPGSLASPHTKEKFDWHKSFPFLGFFDRISLYYMRLCGLVPLLVLVGMS